MRGAAHLSGEGGPAPDHPAELDPWVARRIEDLSRPELAMEAVLGLGARAVGPLRRYLDRPPQSVPHARRLAARLLGLIGGNDACDALRALLRRHDLKSVAPTLALSESVVKDEATVQLAATGRREFAEDYLLAFRTDRLPAAAAALADLRVVEAIPDLVAALEDGLLADRAVKALREFGPVAGPALIRTLGERRGTAEAGVESQGSRTRRILAAGVLAEIGALPGLAALHAMASDANPSVAAAASLAILQMEPGEATPELLRTLVLGGLSPDWRVRMRCQEAAAAIGAPCAGPAAEALAITTIADTYGVPRPVRPVERRWLVKLLLERAPAADEGVGAALLACDSLLLMEALREVNAEGASARVGQLTRHPDPRLRAAVAEVLGRIDGPGAESALPVLASDPERRVRRAALTALSAWSTTHPSAAGELDPQLPAGARWALRLRLWWAALGVRGGRRSAGLGRRSKWRRGRDRLID